MHVCACERWPGKGDVWCWAMSRCWWKVAGVWLQVSDRAQAGRRRKNHLSNLRKGHAPSPGSRCGGGRGDTPSPPTSLADGLPSAED